MGQDLNFNERKEKQSRIPKKKCKILDEKLLDFRFNVSHRSDSEQNNQLEKKKECRCFKFIVELIIDSC